MGGGVGGGGLERPGFHLVYFKVVTAEAAEPLLALATR